MRRQSGLVLKTCVKVDRFISIGKFCFIAYRNQLWATSAGMDVTEKVMQCSIGCILSEQWNKASLHMTVGLLRRSKPSGDTTAGLANM